MKTPALMVLMTAVLVSACGTDKSGATPDASPAAGTPPASAPAAVEPTGAAATDTATAAKKPLATAAAAKPAPAVAPKAGTAAKPASAPVAAAAPAPAAPVSQPAARPAPVSAPAPIAASVAPADLAAGKTVYEAQCRKCHGAGGVPSSAMKSRFAKLAPFDAGFFAHRSDDSVVTILAKGDGAAMKPFDGKLGHGEMVAVAAYIRTLSRP